MSRSTVVIGLIICALATLGLAPFVGITDLNLHELWTNSNSTDALVFWNMRVPRVCLAFLCGAALAVAGMTFQTIFHNVLATPFTLGTSSGAALGATIYLKLGLSFGVWGVTGTSLFALVGAILTIALLFVLTRGIRTSSVSMLLAGVVISFLFSSLILFVQFLSDFSETFRVTRWLMGSFDVVGFSSFKGVLPFLLLGFAGVGFSLRALNLLALDEELALTRGLDVRRAKMVLLLSTSLMVGAVVAVAGPIGFIGIIVPYVVRNMVGCDHLWIMPAVLLLGGSFLVVCDTVARVVIAPFEIPVGVITAQIGAPFFLWVMRREVNE